MNEQLDSLLEKGNGYLLTSDAVTAGISKPRLAEYVKQNVLERAAHGVYMSPDTWRDDYYLIYLCNKRIIFSHESALYLHQMTDREPFYNSVTVPAGYNATHLRKKGIHVYQVKKDVYEVGCTEIETNFHNKVAVYDRERTICDTILHHDSTDAQVFRTAIVEYMKSPEKDLNRLMKYAHLFKIEDIVKMYVEVMA